MPWDHLPVELQKVREDTLERFDDAEKRHAPYRSKCDYLFGLYRSYTSLKEEYGGSSEPDRDRGLQSAKREWGAELFIPYAFATVETILPRLLSNRPRMLVLPRNRASEKNIENVRATVDSQQERIRYELKLQDTAKSGLIFGLGVQKGPFWKTEKAKQMVLQPGTYHEWVGGQQERVLFDGPDVEDVNLPDFEWDPMGHSIDTCGWVLHRTWRDTGYVVHKLISGEWNNPGAFPPSEVQFMSSTTRYDDSRREQMKASGHESFEGPPGELHEVWELHNRKQVIVLLDRDVPVHVDGNPHWHGELPFHAFRPTTSGLKELPGIGEIEPIEHLQREMNTLRSQRRDNASVKLNAPVAYSDVLVEPGDLQFFPGAAIPVNGNPRDLLYQLQVGDIPHSGYQEEANLQADIERVTGISDPVQGTGDASQTATGVQLVQAAANVRIQNKTRRLEVELVASQARQWVALNQQKITSNTEIRVPAVPTPMEPDRRWAWREWGPNELAGEFDVQAEGGSTAPENVPQQRADAQALLNNFRDHPMIDQRRLFEDALRLMGVKAPEGWLAPDQRVPPVMLDLLRDEFKVPEETIVQAYEAAVQLEQQEKQASPNAQQNGGAPTQNEPEKEKVGG